MTGSTDLVAKIQSFGLSVYVYLFRNEFMSQAWDSSRTQLWNSTHMSKGPVWMEYLPISQALLEDTEVSGPVVLFMCMLMNSYSFCRK